MLLQEMQHRVANSLQIIASILLLKSRAVQSEQTRQHLQDADRPVLSVASVQQQLQAPGPHPLLVQAATGTVESSQAVSLGLVTTELVIQRPQACVPLRSHGRNSGEI
jgi:Histidine kinase